MQFYKKQLCIFCSFLLIIGSLSACSSKKKTNLVEIRIDNVILFVEIAQTPEAREQGLMNRESLRENEGMLFIFKKPTVASFWMKNTSIPLDIGYFSPTGELLEIHPLHPYDLTSVTSSSNNIKYVLETNRGFFGKNNLQLGSQLNLKSLP